MQKNQQENLSAPPGPDLEIKMTKQEADYVSTFEPAERTAALAYLRLMHSVKKSNNFKKNKKQPRHRFFIDGWMVCQDFFEKGSRALNL